MYYNDFKLLNAKLLHHYDKEQQLFSLLNQEAHIVDIEEVSKENVLAFRKYLFEDMLYPEQHLHEDLQVFTFNQMVGYMETAIEKVHFILINSPMKIHFKDLIPLNMFEGIFYIAILLSVLFHNRKIIPFTISKVKYFTRRHSYHFTNSNILFF